VANLCLAALDQLRAFLLAGDGVNAALEGIGARDMAYLTPLEESNVLLQNVPSDLADENEPATYPAVHLYCSQMDNRLLRKFSRFSGPVEVVAEVRVSGERFVELDAQLARYVEAVSEVLANHQGTWSENLVFGGAYKVKFGPVREGGFNFIQSARFEIELKGFS